ncbi:BnaC03g45120D [Brassica napus]|uniref:BnaC03g45120D protein n=1 Tax=Brassica napus TaxID=3708 RepID=A0A078IK85_BRANA|nr:BnaC03g45120D [Brassica napus]
MFVIEGSFAMLHSFFVAV